MVAWKSSWLSPPGDAWMARHGLSLAADFKVDAPVVQNFDDTFAQDSGDALWRHLGFQVEPCTTRRERALRTHRLTYEKSPKAEPRNANFECNLTPRQRLDLPQEFWYKRCLRCGIPETWFPDKDHNWRNCDRRCWYCQSMAHQHEPCQGYFRQTINHVRQVISEEAPGLGWYERNTRPQTPPRASPPPVQALPEETSPPAADAPENEKESEAISLLSSSPSTDGRDQEELREVVADALEYPAQDEEYEMNDNSQPHGLDAWRAYRGAGPQEPGTVSQLQPFSTDLSWTLPGDLGEPDPEEVSYFPPFSTLFDYRQVVVQSVERDPSMELGQLDPGAMNVDYDGSESLQTVICTDSQQYVSEHDDDEDDESEDDNSEDDDSEDDDSADDNSDDYGSESNHNSPQVINLTSSLPPSGNSFREEYDAEPQSPLQHDEDMGYVVDESEDQESDGSATEAPSSEPDENFSQSGSDGYPSSDTIMADDGDVDDSHSDGTMQYDPCGLGYLAHDSLSPLRRERSENPPEVSDDESYHLGNLARDSPSPPRKDGQDASAALDNESNHLGSMVPTHLSPSPGYFEGTPVASQNDSCHLGLMARNSLSPLRKKFQPSSNALGDEPHQLDYRVRDYYSSLRDSLKRPSIALDDNGFSDEVKFLPSQQEVAGILDQASVSFHPQLEKNSQSFLSSDQDHGSVSYVSAVEYIHQPMESHSDPHEPTLEFSEELRPATAHFLSSPPSQNIPGASAMQHDQDAVQPHQPQEDQREVHSTPAALHNPYSMTNAGEADHPNVELDLAARDDLPNEFLLPQNLEVEHQNPFFQDDDNSHWTRSFQRGFLYAPMTDLGDPMTSTSLDHVESSSEQGMRPDANTKDGLSSGMDAMQAQLQRGHPADDGSLLNSPPSSQTVAGQEESPAHIDDDGSKDQASNPPPSSQTVAGQEESPARIDDGESKDQASGSSECGDGVVSLQPTTGKTWDMDALEAYYENQRELDRILGDSSSITYEESDDDETDTIRYPSLTPGGESDDGDTGAIRYPTSVSGAESDEDSNDYVRDDENADNDEGDNERHIERSQYDKRRMAGSYEDDGIHNEEQDSGHVQGHGDEDCEDYEEYDDSSNTVEEDHEDNVELTNCTKDTMPSLCQGGSETLVDTGMEDDEDRVKAPSSFTADSDKENRIPEWLFASHEQTSLANSSSSNGAAATQQQPIHTINIHAAQHYIVSAAPALSPSPLSTATIESADGPAYDADHTWERSVTAGIPDAVEEISIDELHALAQTGHADAMHVCFVNRAEAAVDAAAANALAMLLTDDQQQQQPPPPPPSPSHLSELPPSRSPSPLSSPSARQPQGETWRAASAPAAARPRSSRSHGELGEQRQRAGGGVARARARAQTRSRSPERWRVPSFEHYRQRD